MRFLRTNTAVRITVGPFIDKTDGVTPETALTVTNCKLTLTVDTGNVPTLVLDTNPTASGGSNDMVHVSGDDAGFYDLELAAADVNYLGRAVLALTDAANHCPVFHEFMILPAMIYDSLVLGTGRLDTNVTHIGDTAQTARDIGASVLLSNGTGTGQLKLASGYVAMTLADVAVPSANSAYALGALWYGTLSAIANGTVTLPGGHGLDHEGNYAIVLVSGTAAADATYLTYSGAGEVWNVDPAWNSDSETTPSGTIVAYIIAAPKIPTSAVPTVKVSVGTGTGQINLASGKVPATIAAGDIANSAITAASIASDAITDAKVASDVTIASVTGAVGSVGSGGITSSSFAAGAITASAIAADAIGASELAADAVAEIQSGLSTLTAAGVRTAVGLASANLGTQLSGIQSDTDNIQTRLPAALVGGRMDSAPDAATVRTAVGLAAANLDTQLDAIPTNTDLTAALDTADDAVLAALTTISDTLTAILADTNEMQTDITDGGRIDLLIDAIKVKTDQLTFSRANKVDSTVKSIVDTDLEGTGVLGDEFAPV